MSPQPTTRWWVRKPSTGGASWISLLPLDDQKTWASPRPRTSSQEACQPRGMKTIAQAFKSHLATLTGEVLAEDIQYSKETCNIAISGNIKHPVYLLRLSVALSLTWAEQVLYLDPFHVTTIARQSRASLFRATEISKGHPHSLTSSLGKLAHFGNPYCWRVLLFLLCFICFILESLLFYYSVPFFLFS